MAIVVFLLLLASLLFSVLWSCLKDAVQGVLVWGLDGGCCWEWFVEVTQVDSV